MSRRVPTGHLLLTNPVAVCNPACGGVSWQINATQGGTRPRHMQSLQRGSTWTSHPSRATHRNDQ